MNREEIIRLAREAGAKPGIENDADLGFLKRFASIVAAHEREACARVCDGWLHADGDQCAAAIRARGGM